MRASNFIAIKKYLGVSSSKRLLFNDVRYRVSNVLQDLKITVNGFIQEEIDEGKYVRRGPDDTTNPSSYCSEAFPGQEYLYSAPFPPGYVREVREVPLQT